MPTDRQLRVIQWTTGNIGRRSLHAIIGRDDMELVGVYAHGAGKVGVDAAELSGWSEPTGITATDDIDAARAVAVERDCMRLHVRLLDEGGAAQRAEVLIALCARTRQPAVTLSSGVQETAHEEVGENESSAAYCSLLSRARLQVLRAPDGALLHAPLRDTPT